ncbi:aldehyde dehydrogenase (NADP(+)) [Pseudoclavibacter sp. AY1F1]|uniref:aldehyde dehydrogenase (NADP(+)) n=1 Tax=Pseudoclavibacter sp. AY1F1 TaxID=2080583 RepID=UPI00215716A9|nr:aldehyde dehydrogenase (NADP(+)) [Pseudoclavibacter sp. AY1F1]
MTGGPDLTVVDAASAPAADAARVDADAVVDQLVDRAARASRVWGATSAAGRATALRLVADALDDSAGSLISIAMRETNLLEGRLKGELARTTFQLRFFADELEAGQLSQATIDHADVNWPMGAPRPDLRRHLVAVGPALVFAASNFPFAFSVAGGDTASALAAGCPVIVKAHSGHVELSVATAAVVTTALRAVGAPEGTFALVTGTENGRRALLHPALKAASFTGSIAGGRALFDLAASREEPIPFFGELGSVNPVFVTRAAADTRATEIAAGFLAAVAGSSGQLCTKPGVLVVPAGSPLLAELQEIQQLETHRLLNARIESGFERSLEWLHGNPKLTTLAHADGTPAGARGLSLYSTDANTFLEHAAELAEEHFGPAAVVVTYNDEVDQVRILREFAGQLTVSVFGEEADTAIESVRELVQLAQEKAGRVLWNQWSTGVSVTYAQQHGGPYPATTAPATTSVGAAAVFRFLRPVAYQGFPEALLPDGLKEANPLGIPRRVDGAVGVTR